METAKKLEKLKDFIEKHELHKDKNLLEYGTSALLVLSAVGKNTILRNLVIGAVVIGAGKLAYDYFLEKSEEEEIEKEKEFA